MIHFKIEATLPVNNYTYHLFFQVNKGELLEKISDIRKEYAEVVKEAQVIQDTQRVTFIRKFATA